MAVTLQVSEVRAEILKSAGIAKGDGAASTALLGRMFHEVFADLVGGDDRKNYLAALEDAEPSPEDWRRALTEHVYRHLVGPRIRRDQAALHFVSDRVLVFWDAVQDLCGWLANLLWTAREQAGKLFSPGELIEAERRIELNLSQTNWTEDVLLVGVADAVLRVPGRNQWCVIELKTGRTSPEADLAQACLYHLMLAGVDDASAGRMALVSFEPGKRERLFDPRDLENSQHALKALIGRVAGVLSIDGPADEANDAGKKTREADPAKPGKEEKESAPGGRLEFGKASPEHLELGKRLIRAIKEFGVDVSLEGEPMLSPTFVRYPVRLGTGVRFPSVQKAALDSQFRLKLDASPTAGHEKGQVVIDLQRPDRQIVRFSRIRAQLPKADSLEGCSEAPLGVDITGRLQTLDFARPESAHLLVAGTTGSGKSEWLRTAIAGLLVTNTPETLKLLPIDPKRSAFQMLRGSPYLLTGEIVYPEDSPIEEVLDLLIQMMESRYAIMGETDSDSLADHIRRTGEQLPRIFCICDEYADLILRDRKQRKQIEDRVTRLGNKARAAGIHLIIATQQPSREVIKGALDATISARVGLKMQKAMESKMLLNSDGAENLLGRGDLLYKCIGAPIRLQSPYLPADEMAEVFGAMGAKSE
ncbi:MAG: FtsK/SpoIIIE domain-containing protein [Blastocatellia bacterium]